jgi:hypothetical protein
VKPNELARDPLHLRSTIELSQEAYGLCNVVVRPFLVEQKPMLQSLDAGRATVENIRLWDWRPHMDAYAQLSEIPIYYRFYDVDVGRYHRDGSYQTGALAARELDSRLLLPNVARLLRLKFRGGPANIDMDAARRHNDVVVTTRRSNASAVTEFAIALILSQTRLISAGHDALREGHWRGDLFRADRTGEELSGVTAGLIGCGKVSRPAVKALKPFDSRILVCDPYVQLSAEDRDDGVMHVDLKLAARESGRCFIACGRHC